ncbi:MAG: ABC transporter ATP-binding protein [Comamonadaceae bacterium]|nr:MAG: ABC transporter ATP-binding protein [Comamonadaceae bacterium]
MSAPLIELAGVSKSFAGGKAGAAATAALDHVSLRIAEGEFVCLLGPSGCGKSTILNLVAGFEQADEGRVVFDGQPVRAPGPDRGVVFQQALLFPWLNVIDNVTFGPRMAGVPAAQYLPEAERYLRLVGLQGFEKHAPWQLSGGMRQRAALARAWLPGPRALLMDEPFGALDAQTRLMMQELLTTVWESSGTTVLFVTHDVDEAIALADRVLVMSARPGRIAREWTIPFERPRQLDDILADNRFAPLRRDVLQVVREQARAAVALESVL